MKFFSMFSGIGGFELGIKIATNDEWQCIGYSVVDTKCDKCKVYTSHTYINSTTTKCDVCGKEKIQHAVRTYRYRFGTEVKNYGDATKINPRELPDFDFLVGGFPCQAFSLAGKRMGFEDTRGTLFFEIARIIKEKRPKIILLENVKGLLSHNKRRTPTTILATLDELGYNAEWQLLNSKYFGVPQNRERVFIIGHLRGESTRQVFPIRPDSPEFIEENEGKKTLSKISGIIISQYMKNPATATYIVAQRRRNGKQQLEPRNDGLTNTLTSISKDNYVVKVHNMHPRTGNPKQGGFGHISKEDGISYCLDTQNSQAIELIELTKNQAQGHRVYSPAGISSTINSVGGGLGGKTGLYLIPSPEDKPIVNTIRTGGRGSLNPKHNWDTYNINGKIRRLTPLECERLQGFPDNWTKYGLDSDHNVVENADTHRYKQCGNAVTVNVIATIIQRIMVAL